MITGKTIALTRQTFAQLAELIALTQVLELGKRKRVAIYTDFKYAFLLIHTHTHTHTHTLPFGKREPT